MAGPEQPVIFRLHAVKRMVELESGEVIEQYPDASPYPARLVLAWVGNRPLHVVVSAEPPLGQRFVITVYEPTEAEWQPDFKRRRT